MQSNSLKLLVENYRLKVMTGEKHIDPASMVRDRCKYCKHCRGTGCPDIMQDLTEFQKWIRTDRFIAEYLTGIANLAKAGRSPDVTWSTELALAKGMFDILDDCVNAASATEVRLRMLIPKAIAETDAYNSGPGTKTPTPARDELLLDIYRWLRPQVSGQLSGGNQRTLEGRVFSSSIMGWWTVKFLNGLARFNPRCRVERVKENGTTRRVEVSYPPAQIVGNFLNFIGGQKGYTIKERRKYLLKHSVASIQADDGLVELEDDELKPDMQAAMKEWRLLAIKSIRTAVEQLPEPHRTVFKMKNDDGKTLKEIALHLWPTDEPETKTGSLKGYHARAKEMLKDLVNIHD